MKSLNSILVSQPFITLPTQIPLIKGKLGGVLTLALLVTTQITSLITPQSATAQDLLPPAPPPFPFNESLPTLPPAPFQPLNAYTLGAGDRIQIYIFNIPEYSGENGQHQVQVDGNLTLPLVGKINVAGMTLETATDAIQEKYGEYLQRPLITLNLLAARPLQIAIAGEVNRPGAYTVSPTAALGGVTSQAGIQLPSVTRVLQLAGGITASADVRQVTIRRPQRHSGEQILTLNLWELLQSGDLSQDITLRDGDTIFVPTVTDLNRQEATQLAAASFAGESQQPINVAVVGAVNRPGTYTFVRNLLASQTAGTANVNSNILTGEPAVPNPQEVALMEMAAGYTVTSAIKRAGGITPAADVRNIQVRRLTRANTEQLISVDLWKLLQEGDLSQDVTLQQGDTVIIPQATEGDSALASAVADASFSPDTVKVSVIGEVIRPGTLALTPNSTLNQALAAAGGFNRSRADTKAVELIRLNANGTVVRQRVPVDLSSANDSASNPILKPNDVIVVGRSGGAAFSDRVGGVLAPLNPINGVLGIFRLMDGLF